MEDLNLLLICACGSGTGGRRRGLTDAKAHRDRAERRVRASALALVLALYLAGAAHYFFPDLSARSGQTGQDHGPDLKSSWIKTKNRHINSHRGAVATASAIAPRSAPRPCPVRALKKTRRILPCASRSAAPLDASSGTASGTASILFQTRICGISAASSALRTCCTCSACSRRAGLEASTTCSNKSACTISSSVARNAATSSCGKS